MTGTSIRTFDYHKDGYLVEIDFYVNIHPYMTQGFYMGVFVRLVPSNPKEYLWLYENGDIEGETKKFSERLGLYVDESKKINVKLISEDLSRLNEAFNIIGRSGPDQQNGEPQGEQVEAGGASMSYQEALELYNVYSVNQGDILVKPLNNQENNKIPSLASYAYKCNIVNSFISPIFLKLVILDDKLGLDTEEDDDNNEKAFINHIAKKEQTMKAIDIRPNENKDSSGDFELNDV